MTTYQLSILDAATSILITNASSITPGMPMLTAAPAPNRNVAAA
eukprot:CAMPEP_0182481296 /NCGR_PEP_ID=MMETSP1319-20130603/37142_1 /TAXON_ID=172717 /ORGANISM="Bolidomonas pacifica, Strain RCC208" /LENGTH=43 /DNA_ID= /DNA_START= /DNA_END= /DNA_ORIENTATION=